MARSRNEAKRPELEALIRERIGQRGDPLRRVHGPVPLSSRLRLLYGSAPAYRQGGGFFHLLQRPFPVRPPGCPATAADVGVARRRALHPGRTGGRRGAPGPRHPRRLRPRNPPTSTGPCVTGWWRSVPTTAAASGNSCGTTSSGSIGAALGTSAGSKGAFSPTNWSMPSPSTCWKSATARCGRSSSWTRGGGLRRGAAPLRQRGVAEYFRTRRRRPVEGNRFEVNLEATRWVAEVAARLRRGFVLTVDYGYPGRRTLRPFPARAGR